MPDSDFKKNFGFDIKIEEEETYSDKEHFDCVIDFLSEKFGGDTAEEKAEMNKLAEEIKESRAKSVEHAKNAPTETEKPKRNSMKRYGEIKNLRK